jgi:hypothetical protein
MILQEEGIAAHALKQLGLTHEALRKAVVQLMGQGDESASEPFKESELTKPVAQKQEPPEPTKRWRFW